MEAIAYVLLVLSLEGKFFGLTSSQPRPRPLRRWQLGGVAGISGWASETESTDLFE